MPTADNNYFQKQIIDIKIAKFKMQKDLKGRTM